MSNAQIFFGAFWDSTDGYTYSSSSLLGIFDSYEKAQNVCMKNMKLNYVNTIFSDEIKKKNRNLKDVIYEFHWNNESELQVFLDGILFNEGVQARIQLITINEEM